MWHLIVSVPGHCLSFYFSFSSFINSIQNNVAEEEEIVKQY